MCECFDFWNHSNSKYGQFWSCPNIFIGSNSVLQNTVSPGLCIKYLVLCSVTCNIYCTILVLKVSVAVVTSSLCEQLTIMPASTISSIVRCSIHHFVFAIWLSCSRSAVVLSRMPVHCRLASYAPEMPVLGWPQYPWSFILGILLWNLLSSYWLINYNNPYIFMWFPKGYLIANKGFHISRCFKIWSLIKCCPRT